MENRYDQVVLKADREVYFTISSQEYGRIIIEAKLKKHLKPEKISPIVLTSHELYGKAS